MEHDPVNCFVSLASKQPTDGAHMHSYLKPCRMHAQYIFRLQ